MPTDEEKLRVLLPHWIQHNEEHAAEFRAWSDRAAQAAPEILEAARQLETVNAALQAALDRLGGPLASEHHHH